MGYVFCLSAAFALAKFVRDNERRRVDTPMWRGVVWGGFFVAMALTALGPGAHGDQPGVAGLPLRELAVPDLEHCSRSPRRCATRTTPIWSRRARTRDVGVRRRASAAAIPLASISSSKESVMNSSRRAARSPLWPRSPSRIASTPAAAQSTLSEASALSALPVAVSVAAPVMILSTGAALTRRRGRGDSAPARSGCSSARPTARARACASSAAAAGASVAAGTVGASRPRSAPAGCSRRPARRSPSSRTSSARALLYNERITR